jgi:hypothetical protein
MKKVYVVMVGHDYEGYSDIDMKVFANKEDADKYAQSLETEWNFVDVFEKEVE